MTVPVNVAVQLVVTRFSFKTASATRAASALRAETSPERLAMCSASTATGTTIAMSSSAASTSASVNAEARRFLSVAAANFITHTIGRLDQPKHFAALRGQAQLGRARFVRRTVRQEAD